MTYRFLFAALIAAGLGLAPAAFAQGMNKDKMEKTDGMSDKDKKTDAMKKDGMSKDNMKSDNMKKDTMSPDKK